MEQQVESGQKWQSEGKSGRRVGRERYGAGTWHRRIDALLSNAAVMRFEAWDSCSKKLYACQSSSFNMLQPYFGDKSDDGNLKLP